MRKIFLDDLPRKDGIGANKDKLVVDWKASIGHTVKFIYDDLSGEIKITNYDIKNGKLYLNYLDTMNFKMYTGHFLNCKLKELLGLKTIKYKYNIGDIIENEVSKIKILKQIRIKSNSKTKRNRTDKGYTYQCLNCGNTHSILESHIEEGKGCNACCPTPRKIVKGINDIATTHPYLIKYFKNIKDTYTHSYGSSDYIDVICENCGYEKNMLISDLCRQGISCPKCGDGVSYPNKFMFNVLEQLLDNNFTNELSKTTLKWCNSYKYDFYFEINDEFYIIEAHGMQHYKYCDRGRSLVEEQKNDRLKKELALQNGIKEKNYIIIDCRYSTLEHVKNNIINSEINKLFDLNKINWIQCHEYACSSLVKEICDLWNNGLNIYQISKKLKISDAPIYKYLQQGTELNWCDYKTKSQIKKERIFEVSKLWNNGIKNTTKISLLLDIDSSAIRNYLKEASKMNLCDYDSSKSNKIEGIKRRKKVICVDNNIIFDSVQEVEEKSLKIFNVKLLSEAVRRVCNGGYKQYKGYHFKYVDNN